MTTLPIRIKESLKIMAMSTSNTQWKGALAWL
jgi:hypothetical protein